MQDKATNAAQTQTDRQFVLAAIGPTYYGIDIGAVIEILPYDKPTPIPNASVNIIGLLDVRGGTIPIADLSACLGRHVQRKRESRIIVLEASRIGFVVENVAEVITIPDSSFEPNEDTLSASRFVTEIAKLDDMLVLALDPQAVVEDEVPDDEPGEASLDSAPAVRELFPEDMAGQRKAFIGDLGATVKSLRDEQATASFLTALGERHEGYGALAEHYPVVGAVLLDTLAHIAGDAWTDELRENWTAACTAVQETMIAASKAKAGVDAA